MAETCRRRGADGSEGRRCGAAPNAQPAVAPPSTGSVAPVTKRASSLRRKATKAAISSGPATRPVGLGAESEARSASGPTPSSSRYRGVSTLPVTSALTRMPSPAWASAAARVRPSTPCFPRRTPSDRRWRRPASKVIDHAAARGQQGRELRPQAVEDAGQVELQLGPPAGRVDVNRPAGPRTPPVVERAVGPPVRPTAASTILAGPSASVMSAATNTRRPSLTQPRLDGAAGVLTARRSGLRGRLQRRAFRGRRGRCPVSRR